MGADPPRGTQPPTPHTPSSLEFGDKDEQRHSLSSAIPGFGERHAWRGEGHQGQTCPQPAPTFGAPTAKPPREAPKNPGEAPNPHGAQPSSPKGREAPRDPSTVLTWGTPPWRRGGLGTPDPRGRGRGRARCHPWRDFERDGFALIRAVVARVAPAPCQRGPGLSPPAARAPTSPGRRRLWGAPFVPVPLPPPKATAAAQARG